MKTRYVLLRPDFSQGDCQGVKERWDKPYKRLWRRRNGGNRATRSKTSQVASRAEHTSHLQSRTCEHTGAIHFQSEAASRSQNYNLPTATCVLSSQGVNKQTVVSWCSELWKSPVGNRSKKYRQIKKKQISNIGTKIEHALVPSKSSCLRSTGVQRAEAGPQSPFQPIWPHGLFSFSCDKHGHGKEGWTLWSTYFLSTESLGEHMGLGWCRFVRPLTFNLTEWKLRGKKKSR